ncbi:unnamed protein product [Lymnaea stagnalis]|uniref:Uncharacterized protein n=1 Tax=Lymnaea stagnalis TaxID=6523 RepID=A0AAV2IPC3_LYMST
MAARRLPIVVVLGATGAGKSKLAIEIAKFFGGEIISADSMQLYKGLDIITNKVTEEEQQECPHHMISCLEADHKHYNVVDFRDSALPLIDGLLKRRQLPVIVGGTNYYIESLLWDFLVSKKDYNFEEPEHPPHAKDDQLHVTTTITTSMMGLDKQSPISKYIPLQPTQDHMSAAVVHITDVPPPPGSTEAARDVPPLDTSPSDDLMQFTRSPAVSDHGVSAMSSCSQDLSPRRDKGVKQRLGSPTHDCTSYASEAGICSHSSVSSDDSDSDTHSNNHLCNNPMGDVTRGAKQINPPVTCPCHHCSRVNKFVISSPGLCNASTPCDTNSSSYTNMEIISPCDTKSSSYTNANVTSPCDTNSISYTNREVTSQCDTNSRHAANIANFKDDTVSLLKYLHSMSPTDLYSLLQQVDPVTASHLHPNNRRKIVRSLQVYYQSGRTLSSFLKDQHQGVSEAKSGPLRYPNPCILWVKCGVSELDRRLDDRVDVMIQRGLIAELDNFHKEVQRLEEKERTESCVDIGHDYSHGVLQMIGFKEFHDYLQLSPGQRDSELGKKQFDKGVFELKVATRRYARNQIKWIKNRFCARPGPDVPPVYCVDSTDLTQFDLAVKEAIDVVKAYIRGEDPNKEPERFSREVDSRLVRNICDICGGQVFIRSHEWIVHQKTKKHLHNVKLVKQRVNLLALLAAREQQLMAEHIPDGDLVDFKQEDGGL